MTIEAYLQGIGLTSTETAIYLCGLSYPEIDIQALVRETGVKRPTLYHALETLVQKGLVAKRGSERKRLFVMAQPERLGRVIERNMEALSTQKGQLPSMIELLHDRLPQGAAMATEVSHFEGAEGVKMAIEEAIYCKSGRWEVIAPRRNFLSKMPRAYADYYLHARIQRGIVSRSLWERDAENPGRLLSNEEVERRQPRYLPEAFSGAFASMVILFDEKVLLIDAAKAISAVLIRSGEIHGLLSAMFEGIWSISEPYLAVRAKKGAVGKKTGK